MFLKALIGLFRSRQTISDERRRPHPRFKGKLHYDEDKCVKAHECIRACPTGAISLREDGKIEVDHEKCIRCGECVKVCPTKALTMRKK